MEQSIDQIFQQANTALQEGNLYLAENHYKNILKIDPTHIPTLSNLGITFFNLGKLDEAELIYKKVLKFKPSFVNVHNNLGLLLHELTRFEEAKMSFKKAIDLKPNIANIHFNLGNTLKHLSEFNEAEKSFKRALMIQFNYVEVYNNLGLLLHETGRFNEAKKTFIKGLVQQPNYAEIYNNLGVTLEELKKFNEAEENYKKAIELMPKFAKAYNNLGNIKSKLNCLDEAEENYKKAIELNSDYAEAYCNLAQIQNLQENLDGGLISYDLARKIKPNLEYLLGDLLHTRMHLCEWGNLQNDIKELVKKINNGEKASTPFPLLALIDNPDIQRKSAEIFTKHKFPKLNIFSKISKYQVHDKIKIGYFSSDFKNHATAYLITELFELHDRAKFEIHAFSFGNNTNDQFNLRIKKSVDHFHDIQMMSDFDVVTFARSLEIDIAIDLKGYTQSSRPSIFVMCLAPIQVSYLGYPSTMALDSVDYLVADRTLIPEEKKYLYSEKIVYLPNSYQVNISKRNISKNLLSRMEMGLPDKGFIFCCFNNSYKITPTTFKGWMKILKKVEGSVLWLFTENSTTKKNLKKEANNLEIDENRLIFASKLSNEKHLKRIQIADLFIDTLPCNAHTTASDALRVALPVLTCKGESFASRVTASLLNAINLPELITTTQDEYESLAIELATHPEKLRIIKDKLVNNLATSTLYDTSLFARHLEAAYLIMYERYKNDLNLNDINIKS